MASDPLADRGRDDALLLDMLLYAEEAEGYVRGHSFEDFMRESVRRRALERTLEIVGEAARNISGARRSELPEIPWKLIQGQRNVLAHRYGKINYLRLFRTASEDLPGLIATLRRIVGKSS